MADLSSGLLAVSAICAALRTRDNTGEGSYLDVAMMDGVASWANTWSGVDLATNAEKQLDDNPFARLFLRPLIDHLERAKLYAMPHYGVFATADGHISIGIVDENHCWNDCV